MPLNLSFMQNGGIIFNVFLLQLKHTFKDYPQGVRYITYADGGMDLLFWAGHYGPKMAAPSLRFQLSNTHT